MTGPRTVPVADGGGAHGGAEGGAACGCGQHPGTSCWSWPQGGTRGRGWQETGVQGEVARAEIAVRAGAGRGFLSLLLWRFCQQQGLV